MLQGIGKGTSEGTPGLVDLLTECHARIRSSCALARRIAEAHGRSDDEVAEAAARVHRYFTLALPLHAEDEEASVLPRLRGKDPDVDRELEAMVSEHREHDAPDGPLARVVAATAALAAHPGRLAELAPMLGAAAEALEAHFDVHLGREERVVFPAIRRLVDGELDGRMVAELRARRGGRPPPP